MAGRIKRQDVRGGKRKTASKIADGPKISEESFGLRRESLEEAHNDEQRPRSSVRQEWETFKAIKSLVTGPREQVPEYFLRYSIAQQLGIRPEDVTSDQIRHTVVAELLPYYPAITVVDQQRIRRADDDQFQVIVDEAKQLLLRDLQQVADGMRSVPISLLGTLFYEGSQQCIKEGFARFLQIGMLFPNESKTNPAKWARSMAAGVITDSVKGGPFEVCLQQLVSLLATEEAIALLNEAVLNKGGQEGKADATELTSPDADAVIGGDRRTPVVGKNAVQLTSTVNKTALTDADPAESKSLEPHDSTRADLEVAKEPMVVVEPKAKRGPKANMKFHHAVAKVVRSQGPDWKKHLEQIVRKLDRCKTPPLPRWEKRNPPARSWERAWQHYPDVVLKALEYSLKMAAKDIT